jgi:hypothetical protein
MPSLPTLARELNEPAGYLNFSPAGVAALSTPLSAA